MYTENKGSNSANAGGLGFVSVLTLIFIILKLVNVIDWSWLWVLSPIWISLGLIFLVTFCGFIYFIIRRKYMKKKYKETRKRIKEDLEKYYFK